MALEGRDPQGAVAALKRKKADRGLLFWCCGKAGAFLLLYFGAGFLPFVFFLVAMINILEGGSERVLRSDRQRSVVRLCKQPAASM